MPGERKDTHDSENDLQPYKSFLLAKIREKKQILHASSNMRFDDISNLLKISKEGPPD